MSPFLVLAVFLATGAQPDAPAIQNTHDSAHFLTGDFGFELGQPVPATADLQYSWDHSGETYWRAAHPAGWHGVSVVTSGSPIVRTISAFRVHDRRNPVARIRRCYDDLKTTLAAVLRRFPDLRFAERSTRSLFLPLEGENHPGNGVMFSEWLDEGNAYGRYVVLTCVPAIYAPARKIIFSISYNLGSGDRAHSPAGPLMQP